MSAYQRNNKTMFLMEFANTNQRITRYQNPHGLTSLKKYKNHIRQSPSFSTTFNKPPNYATKGRNKKPILLSQVLRGETSLPQYFLPNSNKHHTPPSSSFPGANFAPYIEADTINDSHPPPSYESNSLDSPAPSIFYSNNNIHNPIKEHSNKFNGNSHNLVSQHAPPSGPTAVDGDFIFPSQTDHKNIDEVYFENPNKFRKGAPISILSEETNNDEVIIDKVRNNNNNNVMKYISGNVKGNKDHNNNNRNNNHNNKPTPSYLDKDIRALFNRIKMQSSYDNNNNNNNNEEGGIPTPSSYYNKEREGIIIGSTNNNIIKHDESDKRDVDRLKSALSKLLIPLLPEFTQLANNNDRGKREEIVINNARNNKLNKNNTKIIYIMEENEDDDKKLSYKPKENGNTVFVVLTPSDFKAATNILSSSSSSSNGNGNGNGNSNSNDINNDNYYNYNNNKKNKDQYKQQQQQSEGRNNEEAITAPSIENIALQKYIMSLAGLAASPS